MKTTSISQRRRATIWVLLLSLILGLLIWHAVRWHTTGMYLVMLQWLETGKAYLTVLYNLGLMLVMGTLLGWLTEQVATLVNSETKR